MKRAAIFRTFKILLCVFLAGALFLGAVDPVLGIKIGSRHAAAAEEPASEDLEQDGVNRPQALEEGLSRKSLEEVGDRRVTIRQPVMQVLDRNVPRSKTELLDNTFTLPDFTTGLPYEDGELASVTFDGEPGNLKNPQYPMLGLNDFNGNESNRFFSNFEKYMLLRQSVFNNQRAMQDAANGTLKKHPAADHIYGEIPENVPAVEKRIVTDPVYRSPMTTGLYLAPGEVATVSVQGLREGETVVLYTQHQDSLGYKGSNDKGADVSIEEYYRCWDAKIIEEARAAKSEGRPADFDSLGINLNGQWQRQNQKIPCMGTEFSLSANQTYKIGSPFGGALYVKPTSSYVELVIRGAVETPHFVLGVTTKQEFEDHLRQAPGLTATLDCENGQLIGPADDMRNCDDIEKLAYFWHSVFSVNASFNGRAYNYNVTLAYDMHVPAGEAVALNSSFAAQPARWFKTCMQYGELTTRGNWGTLHELGHIHGNAYGVEWGMHGAGEGEVRNNVLIVLIYTMLCNMDTRFAQVEHGEFTHPFLTVNKSLNLTAKQSDAAKTPITDYDQFANTGGAGYFDQISLYANLIHAFGPEKFVSFFYTYSENKSFCTNTRADFVYRIALVDRVNLFNWVNESYHANLARKDFSEKQWEFLRSLPDFYPIAYRWANGVDGNETARKYEADGKLPTVFDLSEGNILCPKSYRILGFTDPLYGKISANEDKTRVVYTPPKKVAESDEFGIRVSVEGGRTVVLNVRFDLIYRGAYSEVWKLPQSLGEKPGVAQALEYAGQHEYGYTEVSKTAGKAEFTAAAKECEYYRIRFRFLADRTGTHSFYLRADDASEVTFRKGDASGAVLGTLKTSQDRPNYSTNGKVDVPLQAGETVYIEGNLVNWGGKGYLNVGVAFPGVSEIVDIPEKNITNPEATAEDLKQADGFAGWTPKFFVSVKNTVVTQPVEKDGWKVLKAPLPHTAPGSDFAVKDSLIDGKENTFYHTNYGGGQKTPLPHTFVFDTQDTQIYNYFEVVRRGNQNDVLYHIAVYGAADGIDEAGEGDFDLLYEGDMRDPGSTRRYLLEFEDVSVRYFKLVVMPAANQNFTVLSEVYAGQKVRLEQSVKPEKFLTANDGFTESAANGKMTSGRKDASFDFDFLGTGFDLFSDTDPSYGTADIFVDQAKAGSVDLSDGRAFNKCVFTAKKLPAATHRIHIVATSEAPFNVSFINVDYAVPVEEKDYPAEGENYGDTTVPREFSSGWKSLIPNYRELTEIRFLSKAPEGFTDTYLRIDTYIRVYRRTSDALQIAFVYPGKIVAPKESSNLFGCCASLRMIAFTNFDTSAMTGAVSMFSGCARLSTLDLKGFNTANTLWLGSMFSGCARLSTLDLSSFTLQEGANLSRFFENCVALVSVKAPASMGKGVSAGLPSRFLDETSKRLSEDMTSENAGHTVSVHTEHTFTPVAKIEPTCTDRGVKAHEQCVCGALRMDGAEVSETDLEIEAKGHVAETLPGKAATCKEKGLTAGTRCSVCGEVLVAQEEIPLADHKWGEWQVVKEPTASEEGFRERTCSEGHRETEPIAAGELRPPKKNITGIAVGVSVGAAGVIAILTVVLVCKRKRR